MTTKTPEENEKLCNGCTKCCEYVRIIIPTPKTWKQIDKIKWYLLHNIIVCIDDGDWLVDLPVKCSALNNKGKCSIYQDRPQLCRDYSQDSCERYNNTEIDDDPCFTSIKEFDEYLNSEKNKLNIT